MVMVQPSRVELVKPLKLRLEVPEMERNEDIARCVEVIKQSQWNKRIDLLSQLVPLTELYQQLRELSLTISASIAELQKHIASEDQATMQSGWIGMNNVIAADAICRSIHLLAEWWDAELSGLVEIRALSQRSLWEVLGTYADRAPYWSRRWTCYGVDCYIGPV